MEKSLSSGNARARSQKQQKEASGVAAPDTRIPTSAGGAAQSYHCIQATTLRLLKEYANRTRSSISTSPYESSSPISSSCSWIYLLRAPGAYHAYQAEHK
jgi:hypothetical protein